MFGGKARERRKSVRDVHYVASANEQHGAETADSGSNYSARSAAKARSRPITEADMSEWQSRALPGELHFYHSMVNAGANR